MFPASVFSPPHRRKTLLFLTRVFRYESPIDRQHRILRRCLLGTGQSQSCLTRRLPTVIPYYGHRRGLQWSCGKKGLWHRLHREECQLRCEGECVPAADFSPSFPALLLSGVIVPVLSVLPVSFFSCRPCDDSISSIYFERALDDTRVR